MSVRVRMALALFLAAAAAATLALHLPEYVAGVRAAVASPGATPAATPDAFVLGAFAGLGALVLVAVEQYRRREFGWMAASFLLSYVGIIAYAGRRLVGTRVR